MIKNKKLSALYFVGLRETYWMRFIGNDQAALSEIRLLGKRVYK